MVLSVGLSISWWRGTAGGLIAAVVRPARAERRRCAGVDAFGVAAAVVLRNTRGVEWLARLAHRRQHAAGIFGAVGVFGVEVTLATEAEEGLALRSCKGAEKTVMGEMRHAYASLFAMCDGGAVVLCSAGTQKQHQPEPDR